MTTVKKILWLLLDISLYFVIFLLVSGIFIFVLTKTMNLDASTDIIEDPWKELVANFMPLLIASIIAAYITHIVVFKRDKVALGYDLNGALGQLGVGTFIAIAFLSFGFLLLWLSNWIRVDSIDWNASLFFGFAFMFLIQSTMEEVLSRSYLIPAIENKFGKWVAVLLSSILFCILHLFNPNIALLPILNLFMAGALLGLLYIRYRSIWAPIGLHAAWNFFQGSFFGFEVSGIEVYSFLNTTEQGPDIITGGVFGFEGSILALLMLTTASWIIAKTIHSEDKQTITNRPIQ